MRVRWVIAGVREGCVVVAGWQAASGVGGMRESSGLLTDASSSGVRGADSMSSFPSGRRASRASWVVNMGRWGDSNLLHVFASTVLAATTGQSAVKASVTFITLPRP